MHLCGVWITGGPLFEDNRLFAHHWGLLRTRIREVLEVGLDLAVVGVAVPSEPICSV
jgi:hypothetical protein